MNDKIFNITFHFFQHYLQIFTIIFIDARAFLDIMSSILEIQADNWEINVQQEKRPVVVEFWHDKCVICKEMKPIIAEQPEKYGETVKFTKMNHLESKENRIFAIRNGVRSTPTFIVYCEGRPIGQLIGYREPDDFTLELRQIIDNVDSCLKATPIEE